MMVLESEQFNAKVKVIFQSRTPLMQAEPPKPELNKHR